MNASSSVARQRRGASGPHSAAASGGGQGDHLVERVFSALDPGPPPAGPWRERVTALVGRLRDTVLTRPAALPLTLAHRHRSAGLPGWGETLRGVLTKAGTDGEDRVIALRALLAYTVGAIQQEHLGALSGAGTDAIADLPACAYPHLTDTARTARALPPDREVHGGLEAVLRGLDPARR